MAFNTRIQTRRDTASNWETKNPVLLEGELIIVTTNAGDTRFKIGDGVKTYTQLPFQDESLYNVLSGKADVDHTHDLATTTTPGLVMVDGTAGVGVNTENGNLYIKQASNSDIDDKQHSYKPITPENLDYAVKAALVNNANSLSESERTDALNWLCAMSNIAHRKDSGNVTDLLGTDNCRYVFSNAVAGMPFDGEWWFVDTVSSSSTDITVVAYPILVDTDRVFAAMYVRVCANNIWGDWREIVTKDSNGAINTNGLYATHIEVSDGNTTMGLYANGLGANGDAVWIDQAGDAYFTEVNIGTKDNYKKAATEEYVDSAIPDALSDLSEDSTHRTVTDAEKATWNAKSNFSGSYNDLTDKPELSNGGTNIIMSETDPGNLADGDYWDMIMTALEAPKEMNPYTVTLTNGTGYTLTASSGSSSIVYRGDSYSFTIAISSGYEAGTGFAVKANGTTLTASNGVYTITNIMADQTITVEGVVTSKTTVTITGTGNTTYCYATINGTKRYSAASNIEVEPGSTITFGIYGRSTTYPGWVSIDGSEVLRVTNQQTKTYVWTVPAGTKTINMSMSYTSTSTQRRGQITVTTTK